MAIDPQHGEAHSILAALADTVDYKWDVAERLHRRALAARPVTSIIWFRFVIWHLLPLGRVDEAEAQLRTALATDALNMELQHDVAQCHLGAGRYQQAVGTFWIWWRSTIPTRTGSYSGGPSSEAAISRAQSQA